MEEHVHNGSSSPRYAAIYIRVSTEDQGKRFSIPTQVEACQNYPTHEGYIVPNAYSIILARRLCARSNHFPCQHRLGAGGCHGTHPAT